jgi:bifunctional UDP-N-acetylglucosamine pyrophosphorylase/glucosamine-1-phosphate N-acetyltransferase
MLTVVSADSRGFGRVIRTTDGTVQAIVEEAAATPEQLKLTELNVGAFCFSAGWLWDAIHHIPLSKKGEYYLTDTVELAVRNHLPVQAIVTDDLDEAIGVNTRIHLAEASAAMYRRVNQALMLSGVTIVDPKATYIELGVAVGEDTVIWPDTHLRGSTTIGRKCIIGPNTMITDTIIGDSVEILASVLEGAEVEDNVSMGPFAHLRKGAHLCRGVHMGNFGEVKNSTLGPGTKMGHFSYLGDAKTGENVNIGAGTITCNFDGVRKNPTEIGENAFIGSDTMLVAPVKVGAGAKTGAGAVVTKDIPENTLVVGVPARVLRKLNEAKDEQSNG